MDYQQSYNILSYNLIEEITMVSSRITRGTMLEPGTLEVYQFNETG